MGIDLSDKMPYLSLRNRPHRLRTLIFLTIGAIAILLLFRGDPLSLPGSGHEQSHNAQRLSEIAGLHRDRILESKLKRMLASAPDEIHVARLLSQIESSGTKRLKELGIRARALKGYFEAWEDVHLVAEDEKILVRDDIVAYLSNLKDISSVSTTQSRADIIRTYERYRLFLGKLSNVLFPWTAPYFADHMSLHVHSKNGGRGIVFCGGDGLSHYLETNIRTLRHLGCNLPVEVFYLGEDDMGSTTRKTLESIPGVITRDVRQMVNDEGWTIKGWAGKPWAVLFSSFREVLVADADVMFMQNPEPLFDDPGYQDTGALFFYDRKWQPQSRRDFLREILPMPVSTSAHESRFWTGESNEMQESGVVLVDKWEHFSAMLMVARMNGIDRDGDREKEITGTYDMLHGDKETFWLGWELVGDTRYSFHQGDVGILGSRHVYTDEPKDADPGAPIPAELDEETKAQQKLEANQKELLPIDDLNINPQERRGTWYTSHGMYQVCGQQLLHLDLEGNPLWFNSWLVDDKTNRENPNVVEFDTFIHEKNAICRINPPWELKSYNQFCLFGNKIPTLNQREKDVLGFMIGTAKKVGLTHS